MILYEITKQHSRVIEKLAYNTVFVTFGAGQDKEPRKQLNIGSLIPRLHFKSFSRSLTLDIGEWGNTAMLFRPFQGIPTCPNSLNFWVRAQICLLRKWRSAVSLRFFEVFGENRAISRKTLIQRRPSSRLLAIFEHDSSKNDNQNTSPITSHRLQTAISVIPVLDFAPFQGWPCTKTLTLIVGLRWQVSLLVATLTSCMQLGGYLFSDKFNDFAVRSYGLSIGGLLAKYFPETPENWCEFWGIIVQNYPAAPKSLGYP